MSTKSTKRPLIIIAITLGILIAIMTIGVHFAAKALKTQVEQALGGESQVSAMSVGLSAVEMRNVVIRAPKGWPTQDTLRAERIVIRPDIAGLLSAKIRIASITIDQPYVSVLRTRDGRLRLLPSLLEKKKMDNGKRSAAPEVVIGAIHLRDGVLEFFDASVQQPAHKIRLEQLQLTVSDVQVPKLDGRTRIELEGIVKGVQRNGRLAIDGWTELANKNSEILTRMSGVDLIPFQPYLIKASETGVSKGMLIWR